MIPASELLPAGWQRVRELARGSQGRVVLAERDGERGVVRIVSRAAAHADDLAELSVLARVRHPGLARLLEHGELPERAGVYTIRSWIEGSDLAARAVAWRSQGAAGALEIGRVVARLCPALEHLHRAGFVHGDLKPGNVIVNAAGEPVLTDFGLARTLRGARAGAGVGGTLFAVAPEVLLGVCEDARADLFALGVLLHELLIARRASAREFYSAFPEHDFFAATRTRVEELPEWARDVTARLLARDPASRPSSAGELARALAARVQIALPEVEDPRVAWPARRARETYFAKWVESLRAEFATAAESASTATRIPPVWVQVASGDDPLAVLDELRISLALAGSPSLRIDLERSGRELGDELALDQWVRAEAAAARSTLAFVALTRNSVWDVRRVEGLARALAHAQVAPDHDPALLVVVSRERAPSSEFSWKQTPLPLISREEIERELQTEFDDEPARIAELAEVLCSAASGGAAALDGVLAELAERGTFVRGEHGRRLRPGPILLAGRGSAGRPPPDTRRISPLALTLYAGLSIAGQRATLDELAAITRVPVGEIAQPVDELLEHGWATRHSEAGELVLRARAYDTGQLGVPEEHWRELHAARAALLRARGAQRSEWLPDEWRAAPGLETARALETEMSALREAGLPERALGLFESVRALAETLAFELEPGLLSEAAQAWIALGRAERALELAELLAARPGVRARALAAFVHGGIALIRHDSAEATACFDRAESLDHGLHAGVLLCRAQMHWEAGEDAAIASLWSAVQRGERGELTPRSLSVLDTIRAMSLFRRGDHVAARAALNAGLAAAQRDHDAGREAGLRLNLATIARRSGGDPEDARVQSERAAALYERAGNVRGLAQARVLLAGVLREQGELLRATPLLASSQELRERLGDVSGAATVRGNLGLLLADRGHVLAGRQELESAARVSRAAGRSVHAALCEARAAEVAARFSAPAAKARAGTSESGRAVEADPRSLVAAARRAWLCGDAREATDSARRARELAAKLSQPIPGAEARLLLAWLRCTGERSIDANSAAPLEDEPRSAPLVHEDRTLLALLSGDLAAAESARRAWELTRGLAARGRDDRAARLALALLARRATGVPAAEVRALFDACFARCGAGLRASEFEQLRGTLLGIPDPWPADLAWSADSTATNEDFDMDVVTLLDINHKLVQQEALKDLLGTIVESALAVTGAERGFLVLEEDGELSFDTALDSRRGDIAAPDLEISTSIVRQTLDAGRVLRLSNAVDDPLLGSAPSVSALELRSILCAPVAVDEHLRGVIYLDHRLQQGAFAERAERLLALLADQAALAIRQVRRVEEIKRLNRELSKQMAHKESDLRTARAALRDAQLPLPTSGMVGSSPALRAVHALVERAAPAKLSVLVSGESGTGKELVARALHSLSPRHTGPFISENCAALPAALIESELFGYKKGAFTGAEQDRTGLFERAHGGTLFLDEIGELPIELQAKLLRVLETGEVRRVGDTHVRQVDFRLVAATNRDLAAEIAGGRFRADLYYRLDGLRIALPPLAERVADIPELVEHFLRIESAKSGRERRMSPAVLARLCRRAWPGNVRELANEVARLCVLSEGDVVAPELVREPGAAAPGQRGADALLSGELPKMDELERRAILRALELCDGDKRKAAEMLGISRAKVYQRLKDWRGGEAEIGESESGAGDDAR